MICKSHIFFHFVNTHTHTISFRKHLIMYVFIVMQETDEETLFQGEIEGLEILE